MTISARELDFQTLNAQLRAAAADVHITDCCGQRYIGSGRKSGTLTLTGTPGNALAAYLDGARVEVHGNVQDAVGDTMNGGRIVVHGGAGDALGYAMRGGGILIRDSAGYRAGIHMKEYREHIPFLIIGGKVGSFLGEYQAGGRIIVLGIGVQEPPIGSFAGTGMHGGKIFVRTEQPLTGLPEQVSAADAGSADLAEIAPLIQEFAECFAMNPNELLQSRYQVLKPNAKNPYKQLYTAN